MRQLCRYFSQFSSMRRNDTIFALSSGINTAISIVRISGPNAYRALNLVNPHLGEVNLAEALEKCRIKARYMHLRRIYKEDLSLLDKGMIVYFPAQQSYNNEDMFELHLHGSRAVVSAVFKELHRLNMRVAQKGEFTKRAVENGKININQAEAIRDLIASETEFDRQIAVSNLVGKNIDFLTALRESLVLCLAKVEAYLTYHGHESSVEDDLLEKTQVEVSKIIVTIEKLLQNYTNLQSQREGINVGIIGSPNAGKSTLMNLLARKDVSIVSSTAGTTRDLIETSIEMEGVRLNLIDTAGLREHTCEIEMEGIRRTKAIIKETHLNLLILDLESAKIVQENQQEILISMSPEEQKHIEEIDTAKMIVVGNKIDTFNLKHKQVALLIASRRVSVPLLISAKHDMGTHALLKELKKIIQNKFYSYRDSQAEIYITRARHFQHLNKANTFLHEFVSQTRADFACQTLKAAIKQIEETIGPVHTEQMLDVLFRQFCVGK